MKHFRLSLHSYLLIAFVFIVCSQLNACSTASSARDRLSVDFASQPRVYIDQHVSLSALEISVRPEGRASSSPKVLFVPFRVTQKMDDPNMIAYTISRTFFQTWNAMKIFKFMEFSNDPTMYRRDYSLALARSRGADIVVGGFITRLYAGGSIGSNEISVQLEAIDTHTGELLWVMAEAASVPGVQEKDYIFFSSKTRLPTDPIHILSQSIAASMGEEFQNWLYGAKEKTEFEQFDEKLDNYLFPKPGTLPPARENVITPQEEESAF